MVALGLNRIANPANILNRGTFHGELEPQPNFAEYASDLTIDVSGDFYDSLDAYSSPQVGSISQSMVAMQPAESTVIVSSSSLCRRDLIGPMLISFAMI
jgi:hypothetical protein